MKKQLKILVLVGLVSILWLSRVGRASAANDPFTCSPNFYQVISGQLKVLNPVTGVYTNIGNNAGFSYNSIGYNILDNYIYGIVTSGPQVGDLIRVGSDGTTTDLGLPTGLPPSGYVNGSFDLAGNLYIMTDPHTVYKINVGAMTATPLTISGDPIGNGAENVFINNKLYLLIGSALSIVNLTTNSATTATVNGPSGWLDAGNGFGAGWTDQAGELFFSNNASGSIYQITNFDTPTPTATFKVAGTVTSNNDGASCTLAALSPFDPPVAANDSYTIQFNTNPKVINGSVLSNDLGNSLTVATNTSPTHGTLVMNANGTFTYTPSSGFSGTDSFNYTVVDSVGRTASATVSLTVSAPIAPDTGYGTPYHTKTITSVLALTGFVSLGGGLGLLFHQKHTKVCRYRV